MPVTIPLHQDKSDSYYSLPRTDLVAMLPRPVGRVLDVGCGEGGVGGPLRAAGAEWLEGIEILAEPAAEAAQVYDKVHVADASAGISSARGVFDTLLCYDVLEHIYDPEQVLRELLTVAAPGAHLHVSVPNVRHVSVLRDLVLRGRFGYEPFGIRDATHIRWFTRRDIAALVTESGWNVLSTDHAELGISRLPDRVAGGRLSEFLAGQWYVLARRSS